MGDLFFPYDYYDLSYMPAFKNLITLVEELLDCGYYYLFDYIPLNLLVLSFTKYVLFPEDIYL